MKNAVILTGHGQIASGIYSSVKMIAGEFENIRICEFKEGENYEKLDEKLEKAYEDLKAYDNIVVLADIGGGTPFNRAVLSLSKYDKISFVSGVNFEMLYYALTSEIADLDLYIKDIMDHAKASVFRFE